MCQHRRGSGAGAASPPATRCSCLRCQPQGDDRGNQAQLQCSWVTCSTSPGATVVPKRLTMQWGLQGPSRARPPLHHMSWRLSCGLRWHPHCVAPRSNGYMRQGSKGTGEKRCECSGIAGKEGGSLPACCCGGGQPWRDPGRVLRIKRQVANQMEWSDARGAKHEERERVCVCVCVVWRASMHG